MRRMEIIDNFKRTNKKIKRKTILETQNELAQAILKKKQYRMLRPEKGNATQICTNLGA